MIIGKDNLNNQELIRGALFALVLAPIMGWWCMAAAPACAYLYALSGCTGRDKVWRRVGVSATAGLGVFLGCFHVGVLLGAVLGILVLAQGYGWPDASDKGSWIGRIVQKSCPNDTLGPIAVHAVIYAMWCTSFYGVWRLCY